MKFWLLIGLLFGLQSPSTQPIHKVTYDCVHGLDIRLSNYPGSADDYYWVSLNVGSGGGPFPFRKSFTSHSYPDQTIAHDVIVKVQSANPAGSFEYHYHQPACKGA